MRYLRIALCSILAAALVACATGIGYMKRYGSATYPTGDYFQYVSGEQLTVKDDDPQFLLKSMDSNSMLLFGSSEMNITYSPTHPYNNFYHQGYDRNFTLVGATGTQSLWAAMEIGALDQGLSNKKVVFIVSQQWFGRGGIYANVFQKRYSAKTMSMLLANPDISQDTKKAILARAATLLADTSWQGEVQSDTVPDRINSYFNRVPDTLRIDKRAATTEAPREADVATYRSVDDIDWESELSAAREAGAAACTTNDYGIEDGYYQQYCAGASQGYNSGSDWSNSTEYEDLALFLKVCNECGIEPMIVIQPVKGAWADYAGVSQSVRNVYYDNVRAIANEYGAQVADFSSYEYDTYFLSDTMHLGWEGWLYVEKAVIDFYEHDQG